MFYSGRCGVTVTIRPETPEDYDAVRQVNLAAFDTATEADLADAMRQASEYVPELSLVAEIESHIVGHALFSEVTVEQEHGDLKALSLGPIAVLPDHQSQGIGSALIEAGHTRGREMGYPFVVLIGHPWYYPRFGYVPARQYGLETIWDVSDPVFMVCELEAGSLERAAGRIRYPQPFVDL
jgi:putative acetyltransferase